MIVRVVSSLVSVLLLAGVWVDKRLFHTAPVSVEGYHDQVRAAAEATPRRVGAWVATDSPVPQAVVRLLKPNVIIARQYHDLQSGRRVNFLLVHVKDARDIIGHYPPICYKSQGWRLASAVAKDWELEPYTVHGTRYDFTNSRFDRASRIAVDNFMILPDGTLCRDMKGVERVARDHRTKFFGAAQMQLVYDGGLSAEERDDLFDLFVRANEPLINVIRSGMNSGKTNGSSEQ